MQIDFEVNLRVSATALQGFTDPPTYQVMGVVEVWLTFESDGWHSDSSLGECGDFEEGESGEFVGWFVGCAHSGYDDVGFEAWVGRSLVMRKRLTGCAPLWSEPDGGLWRDKLWLKSRVNLNKHNFNLFKSIHINPSRRAERKNIGRTKTSRAAFSASRERFRSRVYVLCFVF
jgi:hypothetical protein